MILILQLITIHLITFYSILVIIENNLVKIIYFLFKQVSHDVSPVDELSSEPLLELLGENGDINQADSYGRTVLHTLAADGNASLLELALSTYSQVKLCFE